jgi:hypothetical protein
VAGSRDGDTIHIFLIHYNIITSQRFSTISLSEKNIEIVFQQNLK